MPPTAIIERPICIRLEDHPMIFSLAALSPLTSSESSTPSETWPFPASIDPLLAAIAFPRLHLDRDPLPVNEPHHMHRRLARCIARRKECRHHLLAVSLDALRPMPGLIERVDVARLQHRRLVTPAQPVR